MTGFCLPIYTILWLKGSSDLVLDILCPELVLHIKLWERKNWVQMLQLDRRIIIPEWNEDKRNKQGLNVCED